MTEKSEFDYPFIRPELSIQECRNVLSRNGEQYTDEEIKEIRKLILNLVEIDFNYYRACKKEQDEARLIDLSPDEEYRTAA